MATQGRPYNIEERLIAFSVSTIDLVESLPSSRTGNHIGGQLLRSGTSPAPNYGEAQGAESKRDFIHKMRLCLKELRETRVWLTVIQKRQMGKVQERAPAVLAECEELIRIFSKSIVTAKRKKTE